MEISHDELKELIHDAVKQAIPPHRCPLEEFGITLEIHKEHHKTLEQVTKEFAKARSAFLMGVVTTASGGILGLLWLGFKTKIMEMWSW